MPKCLRGTTLVHDYFRPFLAEVDRRIGRTARIELQTRFSFLDAWAHILTRDEARRIAANIAKLPGPLLKRP